MVLTFALVVPWIWPKVVPSAESRFSTIEVPLMDPCRLAVAKHGAFVDVMLPARLALLVPIFAPWVTVPENANTTPLESVDVNVP